jgi:hypothetical protein
MVVVGILVLPLVALCVGWIAGILTGSFGFMFLAFYWTVAWFYPGLAVLVFLAVRLVVRRFANRIANPS